MDFSIGLGLSQRLADYLAERPSQGQVIRDIYELVCWVRESAQVKEANESLNLPQRVEELERDLIAKALTKHPPPDSMKMIADTLHLSRQGLHKKMIRYKILRHEN